MTAHYIGTNTGNTAGLDPPYSLGLGIGNGATGNTIGGTASGARNIISGNSGYGLTIFGQGTSNNLVAGNYIGVDSSGEHPLSNGYDGIFIEAGASNNTIGGTVAGAGNVIAFNGGNGARSETTPLMPAPATPSWETRSTRIASSASIWATIGVVAPGAGTPTGSVEFFDGTTPIATTPLCGSTAAVSTAALTAGTHSITAQYLGDGNFSSSTFSPATVPVRMASTTTNLSSSASTSVFGQSVTFTATIGVVAPGAGVLTGSVTFKDGSTTLGTGTLNSTGQATFATTTLAVGSHTITAVYGGDLNFSGSTSAALAQTVSKDGSTAAITSSASPSVLNQSVSFTVTVSAAAPGSGTPTGTVHFSIDGSKFGSAVALAGGSATSGSISTLKLGNHTITESYSGDGNFTASTAPSFTQVVSKDNTTTKLVATVNPSVYGQSISFTASVAAVAPGTGTPTGSVTFFDGSTTLKTVTLTAGAASYTTTKLVTGQHAVTALYNGNSTFAISTSAALTQTVNQDHTSRVVTASADPSAYGQSVTFTATVSAAAPGSGTPTGSVTFMDGSTALGSATLRVCSKRGVSNVERV